MAGGITTPELVAAVSNAGGLGSIGAGYLAPDAIRAAIHATREKTQAPFAVNLFVPQPYDLDSDAITQSNTLMAPFRQVLNLVPPSAIASYAPSFDAQLAVVVEERVPIASFTFGIPAAQDLERVRAAGITIIGTATTVAEARALETAGVDMIVAQGAEAGGHRGTFLDTVEAAMVGTMALVPQVVDAVSVPVIASGGIMDHRGVTAALLLGADAVQMGSAFLVSEESGAHPPHKKAMLKASDVDTVVTRAFSGKPARGISNRFIREMATVQHRLPPYPVQNAWTKDIRAAAAKQGNTEFMSLWAGQAAGLGQACSVQQIMDDLDR